MIPAGYASPVATENYTIINSYILASVLAGFQMFVTEIGVSPIGTPTPLSGITVAQAEQAGVLATDPVNIVLTIQGVSSPQSAAEIARVLKPGSDPTQAESALLALFGAVYGQDKAQEKFNVALADNSLISKAIASQLAKVA